ncbi:hypothetical protein [Halobaculum limi]|uniref:hypothetical protein n=1 Tax=Halobaculum limi TaxID=3031916 RepID=UPI002405F69E|nr:hypothetical protein [Halobaculum sp. YSMS11]
MEEPASTDAGAADEEATILLPASLLARYRMFSLYNSPYPAHDRSCAVDLYPESNTGVSPVAGAVVDTRTVRCPDRSYAVDHDHLIVVDTGDSLARILHVNPAVEAGDVVAVGDSLGEMVRSGFFGRWVDNHVHLELRDREKNPYRASGSEPLAAAVDVTPLSWDGTGTVVETGSSYAILDAPGRPASLGDSDFTAVADDDGIPLDGGLCHYTGGGVPGAIEASKVNNSTTGDDVQFLGTTVGTRVGRHVDWADVDVLANGERITGLSLFASRERGGVKLVTRPEAGDPQFAVGDTVEVDLVASDDPVRLG